MKDRLSLLAAGAIFALFGWAIWHYFGSDANSVILSLLFISTLADNIRLRRQLQQRQNEPS